MPLRHGGSAFNRQREREPRVNERIRISPVRLIGPEGEQIGIVPVKEALDRARAENLDLVEVSSASRPPVCRIMDYGRYKYETSKKQKAARKKQHSVEIKEMRFRPKVDTHDYEFKTKHIREFLEDGNKVRVFVMFRGREMAHTEFGRELLDRVSEDMKDIADVESPPNQEGRRMTMQLAPHAEVIKKAAKERAAKIAAREKEKHQDRDSNKSAKASEPDDHNGAGEDSDSHEEAGVTQAGKSQ